MNSNEWISVKLGELIDSISVRHDFKKEKLVFLNTSDVLEGKVLHQNYSEVSTMPGQAKKSIKKNDILFSEIRPKNKRFAYIDFDAKDYVVSTKLMVLRRKSMLIDNKFLYKLLTSDKMLNYLQHIAEGRSGTFPQITFNELKNIEVLLPTIHEQILIAKMLDDLDEKIEINNKINDNLEKIAQAIFKQWFVDFEFPKENGEQYKSSGGEMIESELGMIPKGWKIESLGNLIDIVDNRGKTPPQEKEKTEYPIIDVKALAGNGRVIDYKNCVKFVSKNTYENWFRSGHPKEGDVLMSTVGSLAELKIFYGSIGCIAQNVVALRSKDISNLYLYQYLKNIKGTLVSYNIGSVQPSIKITHVTKHNMLVPNKEIINKYHNKINEISKNIFINNKENEALIKLRDTLLPKLMSGEIRVPLEEN